MDAFLGTDVFCGSSFSVPAFAGSFVAQALFKGCIAFTNWPRQEVYKLLPPELELAVNTSSAPDLHPVVFIFGDLVEGATIVGGFTIPTGISYQEVAIAIPFVKHAGEGGLHTYIPRMYSTYFPPTWSGNTHYGFSKEMAKLGWQGPVYIVTAEDGALLLHAAVESSKSWSPGRSCELPNFAAMQAVFSLPVVGRKSNGTYVCSHFGWDFSEAAVRAADSYVSIDAPLLEGLTPRRCHDVASGSFDVRGMKWRLSWPSPCRFR